METSTIRHSLSLEKLSIITENAYNYIKLNQSKYEYVRKDKASL